MARSRIFRHLSAAGVAAAMAGLVTGCGGAAPEASPLLRVWAHQGQENEVAAMKAIAAAFEDAHAEAGVRVELTFFPASQYTEKIATAAAARDLPDVYEIDGPLVAQFAEAGLLRSLEGTFTRAEREDILPTLIEQGTYQQTLYAVGAFESALVLYVDRERLAAAGVEPPPRTGWAWEDFVAACATLKAAGQLPLALHMDERSDEWFTYAFTPVIWSSGGRLLSPDGTTAEGVLDDAINAEALAVWAELFAQGYAERAPVNPDPFGAGETAMDWNGHWMARSHLAAKGGALGVAALPWLGEGPVAPSGSWCWGVASSVSDPELADRWIRWVTGPETGVQPMVEANGAIPGRRSAFELFPDYDEDPYRLFREQIEGWARPRPRTPAYATLTRHVAAALRDIANGGEPGTELSQAADAVQRVLDP